MKKLFLWCLLIFTGLVPVSGQIVMVSGYVLQKDADIPIPFASLINKKNRTGTSSDINGFYTFLIAPGDTVEVSAVGFEKLKMVLPREFVGQTFSFNLRLSRMVYDLPTVNIGLMNYERFKKEFEAMSLPEDRRLVVGDPTVYRNYYANKENFGYTIKGPFTAIYNKFNKKAKELEKLRALMENDNFRMTANRRLTKETIQSLTGLKTDDDINRFLQYCNLGDDFVAGATEYDMMIAIDRCYDQYAKERNLPSNDSLINNLQLTPPR